MKSKDYNSSFSKAIFDYHAALKEEIRYIWNNWDIKILEKEIYEVIIGLLTRQVTITIQFTNASYLWTDDIGPLVMRCLLDNYINYSWILIDKEDRVRKYIAYGLGQEKLIVEHRKRQIELDGNNPEEDSIIKSMESWIDFQHYTFMTDVNVGSWAGLSVREMAIQSNCKELYDLAYLPFSTTAHNMWNHISKFNLTISQNPLHKFLFEPNIDGGKPSLHYLYLAAKYTDIMINKYYEVFTEVTRSQINSYSNLLIELEKVVEDDSEE